MQEYDLIQEKEVNLIVLHAVVTNYRGKSDPLCTVCGNMDKSKGKKVWNKKFYNLGSGV